MERNEHRIRSVELHAYFHLPAREVSLVEAKGPRGVTRLGLEVGEARPAA